MEHPAAVVERLAFAWKDHSRYVNVVAVQTGWLVVWGKYEDAGARKLVHGSQVYRDPDGARRRLVAAIVELTAHPGHAADALALLDRQGGLMRRELPGLPDPL
ncbi:MAG: hypothetical protein ACRDJW_10630 [Thermomicrobiales bacterium]